MKLKGMLLFAAISLIALGAKAQKGNNELSINGEVAIPGLQNQNGFFALAGVPESSTPLLVCRLGLERWRTNNPPRPLGKIPPAVYFHTNVCIAI